MTISTPWLAVLLPLLLLPGCASNGPPPIDASRVKEIAGRGYQSDNRYTTTTAASRWNVGEYSFDIAWNLPATGSGLPLVVYLPGLGESRGAGEAWRNTWAQAGYAVLSIQLLDDDRRAWSSAAARRADFGLLARERYGKEAASARMKALATLLAELGRRHDDDTAILRRLDLSRIALAGFDIGAYSAMLAAGEAPKDGAEPVRLPIPLAAVVALSPYADFSGSALSSRYRSIDLPVLSVSGDADTDAAGIVSSPSVRRAPFEYMPSHDAYLLWLTNMTHSVFSGTATAAGEDGHEASAERRGDRQGFFQSGNDRREGRRGGESNGDGSGRVGGRLGGLLASPTERAIGASLIQGTTTAFLDAYLKQDSIAREWLRKDASHWIGKRGELRHK
jgi:dienelactone hydrolase